MNLAKEKAKIKYQQIIKVLQDGREEYMDGARKAQTKIGQDMFLKGADDCLEKIKMIKRFLADLDEIEAEFNNIFLNGK